VLPYTADHMPWFLLDFGTDYVLTDTAMDGRAYSAVWMHVLLLYWTVSKNTPPQNIGTTELYDHCTRQDSAATIHECLIKHKALEFKFSFHCVVYNTTTTTNVLIIVTLHKVAGALYISDLKNDGSSQKSVVRQLKQITLSAVEKTAATTHSFNPSIWIPSLTVLAG